MTRTISPEQKQAMAEGREAAAAVRRQAAVERVKLFREWMDADVEYRRQQNDFVTYGIPVQMTVKPTPPRELPSDNDYKIAREEGEIK